MVPSLHRECWRQTFHWKQYPLSTARTPSGLDGYSALSGAATHWCPCNGEFSVSVWTRSISQPSETLPPLYLPTLPLDFGRGWVKILLFMSRPGTAQGFLPSTGHCAYLCGWSIFFIPNNVFCLKNLFCLTSTFFWLQFAWPIFSHSLIFNILISRCVPRKEHIAEFFIQADKRNLSNGKLRTTKFITLFDTFGLGFNHLTLCWLPHCSVFFSPLLSCLWWILYIWTEIRKKIPKEDWRKGK